MKKLFRSLLMLLMVLCTFTLVACGGKDPDKLTDQEVVDAAKTALTINYTEVTTDFSLPTTAAGGVTVSWASNDSAIVISGQNATVTRPAFEDGNKSVTLTATLAKGDASATKDFTVVVVCLEDVATIDALTVAEAVASEQGATVTVRGIVSGFHYSLYNDELSVQACYITDTTGTVYVYGYLVAQSVEKGDDVVLEATVGAYNGYTQLTSPTLVQTVSKENAIPTEGAKTDKTVAEISADLAGNYTACAYLFEGVQIKKIDGGSYINYVIEDKEGNAINLYSGANSVEFGWLEEYLGKEVKVLFAINSQNSAKTKWRGHVLDVVEVVGDWTGGSTGGNTSGNTSTTATVTEVLAAAATLADGAKLDGKYKTTGTVTAITAAYDASYGNISFKLSDGTNEILCYRTYGDLGASVAVGDTVTVVGEVQNYSGTIEFVYADVTERTAGQGGNVTPTPTPDPTYVTTPETGKAYKLGMIISGDKVVYLTGEMNEYYGASTEAVASGKDVYLEAVEGGYNLYYMSGETKTYIVITISGTHYNITFQATAGYVWTWDATYNTLVCNADGTQVYLGTYGTYSTFGGSDYSKISTSYPAHLFTTEGGNTSGNEGGNTGSNEGTTTTATITEVLSANAALAQDSTTTEKYTITGTVVSIYEAYSSQYGNVSFYVTDGTSQILVFRATGDKAVNVSNNDTITLTGQIKNYNGNLQVVNATIDNLVDGQEEIAEGAVTLTIADYASANSWANSTMYNTINFDEFTTITATGGANTGKYYTNGNNWRIYENESPSVTITSTKTILSVTIEYASEKTGTLTLNGTAVANAATVEVNDNTITFSVGNTGTATNGQARISKITIVYAE